MEKPTGVIQKIIESLQQVNALNVYSPIEKDIILHNLRAAYMIFLNLPVETESNEVRVDNIFPENQEAESGMQNAESSDVGASFTLALTTEETEIEEEPFIVEDPEMIDEAECGMQNTECSEDEIIEIEENVTEEIEEEEEALVEEEPLVAPPPVFQDDLLEFIPDAKPNTSLLFEDSSILKPEKKSLNDLLTEKKDDQSLGTRFQQSFIPDLTKAIGINEKFAFIRELFHNSGVDFSNAIQKLNDCENIDSAFVLMETLKHQYIWDTTSTSYLSLCDLVRRRFL